MNNLALNIDNGRRIGTVAWGYNNAVHADDWIQHHKAKHLTPELDLMRAVLAEAIECAHLIDSSVKYKTQGNRRHLRAEARLWIADDSDWWPFSFRNCCEFLGLDADAVRRAIQSRYEYWPEIS